MLASYFNNMFNNGSNTITEQTLPSSHLSNVRRNEQASSQYFNNTAPPVQNIPRTDTYQNDEISRQIDQYRKYLDGLYKEYYYLNEKQFIKLTQEAATGINDVPPPIDVVREYLKRQHGKQIVDFKYDKDLPFASIKKPGYFQMDLVFFIPQLVHLYLIEMNSRKVWAIPMANKEEGTILNAFKAWYYKTDDTGENVISKRRVVSILSDLESGFGKDFKMLCDKEGIQLFKKDTNDHRAEGLLDRSVSVVKKLLYKHLVDIDFPEPTFIADVNANDRRVLDRDNIMKTDFNYNEWIQNFNREIQVVINDYNNKPATSLRDYTPNEVYNSPKLQKRILVESVKYNFNNDYKLKVHFEVGDLVRFKERRRVVDKDTYWSDHVYRIIKKNRYTYLLGNIDGTYDGNISRFRFKHYELQLVQKGNGSSGSSYYNNNTDATDTHLRRILERPRRYKGDKEIV